MAELIREYLSCGTRRRSIILKFAKRLADLEHHNTAVILPFRIVSKAE